MKWNMELQMKYGIDLIVLARALYYSAHLTLKFWSGNE